MSDKDPKLDLLERALEACYKRHVELSAQWTQLDTKAQGSATVAGVFLAAILTFVRALSSAASSAERVALTAAVVLLLVSIVFALLVLRVRSVHEVCARDFVTSAEELIDASDGDPAERLQDFARDQTTAWLASIDTVKAAVDSKGEHLRLAQLFLFLAIICAAAVTAVRIWGASNGEIVPQ